MPTITGLPDAGPLDGTESLVVVQGGVTKEASTGDLVLGGAGITNIVALTQAAYNALGTPDASTLYVIVP